jgi:hypothetical protein
MDDQKLPSCQTKSPVNIKPSDYTNPDLPDRRWKVSYGKGQVFYLTDEERKFFLGAILAGEKYVQIGLITLSNMFFYIVPLRKMTVNNTDDFISTPMTAEQKKKALVKAAEIKKNLINILNKKND